ncbi:hypothetical protein [Caenimonas sedimenti]|uniref:hypothetical protein n=1 Tax=Caenimonas sedimenti TaxID=2596921 RepID=UPI0011A6A550|nr:hypothetical protein [Caenimonas sedimenti]
MSETLENAYWHDGQLRRVSLEPDVDGSALVVVSLALYKDEQAPDRTPWTVTCSGVSRLVTSVDLVELRDNARAGNVIDGELRGDGLWLRLTGGIVEVHAREFLLDAR